jgi:DNA-binding Xre family transcriptional regulator
MLGTFVAMPVKCVLRLVVARENVKRVESGQLPLTQQQIARETGLPLSVVSGLITGRSQRVDFGTLGKLCKFFHAQPGDLLVWESDDDSDA